MPKLKGLYKGGYIREQEGLMMPFLHLANMILIAISIKSWLDLFHYSI